MEKLMEYPWIIWTVVACVVLLIVIVVILLLKGRNKEVNKTDAEYDKIINEVIKEEKRKVKTNDSSIEESNNNIVEDVIEEEIPQTSTNEVVANEKKETKTTKKETSDKRTVSGKYEVFSENDLYKYVLKASNGEILVESELYSSKDSVMGAIEAVKRNLETGKVSISKDKRDLHQFKLSASNNRTLVVSANYTSKQNAEKALESFKRFALNSPVVEVEAPKNAFGEEIIVEITELKLNGKLVISAEGKGFEFNLYANNGELLCTSQPYTTKANCEKGIETLKDAIKDGSFYIYKDKNDRFQYKLFSKGQRLIAVGQTYDNKQRAISSANSLASFIQDAEIVK